MVASGRFRGVEAGGDIWRIPSGLVSTASTPMVDTSALPMLLLYIVNKTIRTSGIVFFRIDATSIPFISGIDRSSKTRLGFNFLAFSIASNPLLCAVLNHAPTRKS
jgi:hypothetical protein